MTSQISVNWLGVALIDRSLRRLTALQQSGSTARVLNLSSVHNRPADAESIGEAPFFEHPTLDRCIIVKHRLRMQEYEAFASPQPTATKVMLPIDSRDLKLGARYFFVGQKNFEDVVEAAFGEALRPGSRDRLVLDLITSLPSLDPFLLREHLKRNGINPARVYFNISDADLQKMYDFVRRELTALVARSFASEYGVSAYAAKLVEKLLSNSPDADFEPLRMTLKLDAQEYLDGIFAWRGFLYYKWMLADLTDKFARVKTEIEKITPRGPKDPEASEYTPAARSKILASIDRTRDGVSEMLTVYDRAYGGLTNDGQPGAFRDFLLAAPDMFTQLGERLGALQHIISFWRYRFADFRRTSISPSELMDIFLDFEDSLSFALADENSGVPPGELRRAEGFRRQAY